jgi:GntR family transcriptional regulator
MDFSNFDKTSSERLYLQIRQVILRAIRNRDLLPRQKVPSLNELSEMTGVSRVTVRQALQSLINEGWLFTVPGKGTFVAESPRIEQNLQQLMGWTDEIRRQGMAPSSRVIAFETIPLQGYITRWLEVPSGTLVYRISRVRYADAFALALEKTHLVCARYPGLERFLGPNASLYHVLLEQYGVQTVRAIQFLDAGEADQATARLLEIEPGKPVLVSERITYSATNEPIELVIGIQKPGFVRFKTEMTASSATVRQIVVTPEDQSPLMQNDPAR